MLLEGWSTFTVLPVRPLFIDLKSSNILLGVDFRAKVSDFGLVKHAPDSEKSVATKLLGHLDTLPLNMQV